MPRRPRFCPSGLPVHVIQRGNNKAACFTCDADIAAYVHWLTEGAARYKVQVNGWVFMTNHMHLLLTPSQDHTISRLMQFVGRLYVRRFNHQYSRSGTLFEGRFRSSLVQDEQYFLACLKYIELNPIRAGIVTDPADYQWSSYRSHAFNNNATMWSPHPQYLRLGKTPKERQTTYRELISATLPAEAIAKIRNCVNTGLVLGTEDFRNQVEALRS